MVLCGLARLIRYRFFLFAGAFPYFLGVAVSYNVLKNIDLSLFLVGLLGLIFAFIGVESFNEYFDISDRVFLESPRMFNPSPRILLAGVGAFAGAFLIGVYLTLTSGLLIFPLAVAGFIIAAFYVGPPLRLVYRGFGEAGIFVAYGPLMTFGGYYIQTGRVDLLPLFASVIPGLLILSLAILNEIPDYYNDLLSGKRNIVARMGRRRGAIVYICLLISVYAYIGIGGFTILPIASLLALTTAPIAYRTAQVSLRYNDAPHHFTSAISSTVILYLAFTMITTLSYLFY